MANLVVEPRPRACLKTKAKMSVSTKQNSYKHVSGAQATGVRGVARGVMRDVLTGIRRTILHSSVL